jgi:3-deoxy-D-manno-octulosonic-acid transferase
MNLILIFITYQIIQLLILPIIVVYLIIRKTKGKSAFGNFKERVGFVPKNIKNNNTIWFHAVSVGEILSIQYLIKKIKNTLPQSTIYVTTGTVSGKKMAVKNLDYDYLSFLPFDFLLPMLFAFRRIKPSNLILAEAEIWPNLLLLAHFKKIPTFLVNARINKKQNHLTKFIFSKILNTFKHIYTQSKEDLNKFLEMEITKEKLSVLGNIKAYNVYQKHTELKQNLCKKNNKIVLLVGSIHPGELKIYLILFKQLKTKFSNLQLILAPRHFHWQEKLIKTIQETNFSFQIWKDFSTTYESDIILVLKLGVLFNIYPLADIFFLGGTFVPVGGHNLLEPAVWGKLSVIGPHYQNTKDIADCLQKTNGLIKVKNETDLYTQTQNLLMNKDLILEIGTNARTWLEKEKMAVENGLQILTKEFKPFSISHKFK